jgi:hypothetical protein
MKDSQGLPPPMALRGAAKVVLGDGESRRQNTTAFWFIIWPHIPLLAPSHLFAIQHNNTTILPAACVSIVTGDCTVRFPLSLKDTAVLCSPFISSTVSSLPHSCHATIES